MSELKTAENLLPRMLRSIPRAQRTAFVSAFAAGLLAHLFMLTNKLPNFDDLMSFCSANDRLTLGRWFLKDASILSSNYSLPWLTGLISLTALAVTAMLVTALFEIKRPLPVVLASALLVVFPTVTGTFAYMFTADAYFIAAMFAALAAFVTDRYKLGFLAGAVLLAFSTGIYQAYLFFGAALLFARGIMLLLKKEYSDRQIAVRFFKYLAAGLLGYLLYRGILSVCLAAKGVELAPYMGVDQMGKLQLSGLPRGIAAAIYYLYDAVFVTFPTLAGSKRLLAAATALLMALIPLLCCVLMFTGKLKSAAQTALAVVMALLLPVAANCAYVFVGSAHMLMRYSMTVPFIFVIALYELYSRRRAAAAKPKNLLLSATSWVLTVCMTIVCLGYGVIANKAYLRLHTSYENTYGMALRIVDRAEQCDGYTQGTQIYIVGSLHAGNYKYDSDLFRNFMGLTGVLGRYEAKTTLYGIATDNDYFRSFCDEYLGVHYTRPDTDTIKEIAKSGKYASMPVYPAAGSVAMIDGIAVVKGCE